MVNLSAAFQKKFLTEKITAESVFYLLCFNIVLHFIITLFYCFCFFFIFIVLFNFLVNVIIIYVY